VTLSWKETCNLSHPMHLHRPVRVFMQNREGETDVRFSLTPPSSSFKCLETLYDDSSLKPPLPVRRCRTSSLKSFVSRAFRGMCSSALCNSIIACSSKPILTGLCCNVLHSTAVCYSVYQRHYVECACQHCATILSHAPQSPS